MDHPESNKRSHILYLPRWYPHRYDPMPGLFIERHGIAASEHFLVTVLYVHQDDALTKKKFEVVESTDEPLPTIRIYYKKSNTGIGFIDKIVNACRFYRFHQKGIRMITRQHGNPDLIHVHVLTRHGIIALLRKIFKKTPFVVTEHWTRYLPSTNTYNGWFRKKITSWVGKHAAAIMPVTANLRDAMIDCGINNNNYVIIPNVVNMEMFHPSEKKKTKTKKRIVHVSCFDDQQKNITGILRVLKRTIQERDDFVCDMVGDGIDYDKILMYSKELGLPEDTVIFYGLKENHELAEIMANGDFMIMFSNYENLPVVILESYACGVPVVSTDVGGIKEHLDKNLGLLIHARDEEALYNSIQYMLDNISNYDADSLRQYPTDHFSNRVIGNQLWKVYKASINQSFVS